MLVSVSVNNCVFMVSFILFIICNCKVSVRVDSVLSKWLPINVSETGVCCLFNVYNMDRVMRDVKARVM